MQSLTERDMLLLLLRKCPAPIAAEVESSFAPHAAVAVAAMWIVRRATVRAESRVASHVLAVAEAARSQVGMSVLRAVEEAMCRQRRHAPTATEMAMSGSRCRVRMTHLK